MGALEAGHYLHRAAWLPCRWRAREGAGWLWSGERPIGRLIGQQNECHLHAIFNHQPRGSAHSLSLSLSLRTQLFAAGRKPIRLHFGQAEQAAAHHGLDYKIRLQRRDKWTVEQQQQARSDHLAIGSDADRELAPTYLGSSIYPSVRPCWRRNRVFVVWLGSENFHKQLGELCKLTISPNPPSPGSNKFARNTGKPSHRRPQLALAWRPAGWPDWPPATTLHECAYLSALVLPSTFTSTSTWLVCPRVYACACTCTCTCAI